MVLPLTLKQGSKQRFSFNLEGNVGPNSPNKMDDVQLVQFAYLAKAQAADTKPALKAIFQKVVPGAAYTGGANDPLTLAIKAHQADRGGTQDGHVSKMPPSGTILAYDAVHSFMLITLVNNIFDMMPNDFPRLDHHPQCPAALREAMKEIFVR